MKIREGYLIWRIYINIYVYICQYRKVQNRKNFFGGLALNPGIEIQNQLIGWLAMNKFSLTLIADIFQIPAKQRKNAGKKSIDVCIRLDGSRNLGQHFEMHAKGKNVLHDETRERTDFGGDFFILLLINIAFNEDSHENTMRQCIQQTLEQNSQTAKNSGEDGNNDSNNTENEIDTNSLCVRSVAEENTAAQAANHGEYDGEHLNAQRNKISENVRGKVTVRRLTVKACSILLKKSIERELAGRPQKE